MVSDHPSQKRPMSQTLAERPPQKFWNRHGLTILIWLAFSGTLTYGKSLLLFIAKGIESLITYKVTQLQLLTQSSSTEAKVAIQHIQQIISSSIGLHAMLTTARFAVFLYWGFTLISLYLKRRSNAGNSLPFWMRPKIAFSSIVIAVAIDLYTIKEIHKLSAGNSLVLDFFATISSDFDRNFASGNTGGSISLVLGILFIWIIYIIAMSVLGRFFHWLGFKQV
jgi:hypothetical protein